MRILRAIQILYIIILLPQSSPAQNTWTRKADYGNGLFRIWSVGFAIGNTGYIGLGGDESFNLTSSFWSYDPVSNSWTQIADFGGGPRQQAVGFSIGSKGYAGTGYSSGAQNDFWEYDPGLNQWTQKDNVPGPPRGAATGFGTSTKGYLGTGSNSGNPRTDFFEYDPVADSWTAKSDFAGGPREFAVSFSIGEKGYLGTGSGGGLHNDFWEFDPVNDTWTQKADCGTTMRMAAVGFSLGNRGYIGGGTGPAVDFWEYNSITNTWTQVADYGGTGLENGAAFSIGDKGYAGTGYGSPSVPQTEFWEYTPLITDAGITNLNPIGTFCGGSTDVQVTLHNYGNVALTGSTIRWDVNGLSQTDFIWSGNIPPGNETTFSIGNYLFDSGPYTLTAYPENPNGATDFNNVNDTIISFVTVNPNPVPVISPPSPVTLCIGEVLTSSAANGYQWMLNGNPISGATDISFAPSGDGTYSVEAENVFNCTAESDPHTVTVSAIPATPVSGGDQNICSSDPIPALTVTVGAGENADWFTTPGGGSAVATFTTSYTPSAGGTFYAEAVNAAGCRSAGRAAVTLTIHADPAVTITGTTLICSNSNTVFTADPGFSSYSWSTGDTTQSITVNIAQTYSVQVTDANGCNAFDSENLTVNPAATVDAGFNQTVCPGLDATMSGAFGGGASSATWTTNGFGFFINATDPNAVYTPSVNDTSGSVTLTYTTNDPPGICPAESATMILGFYPSIQGTTTTVPASCNQSNGSATVSLTGGGGGFSYLWSDGQTTATAVGLPASNYSVTVTDTNSCSAVFNESVTNVSAPSGSVVSQTNVSCFGGIDGTATISASGGTGTLTYNWQPYGGSGVTATGLEAGPYTVTITDNAGCVATVNVTILQPTLLVAHPGNDTAICTGASTPVGGVATGGSPGYFYSWNTSTTLSDSTLANPIVNPTFTSVYTVIVTDSHGCSASGSVTITVNQPPVIDISIFNPLCAESAVSFSATGAISYVWSNNANSQSTDSVFLTPGPATMSVTGTNGNGCVITTDTTFQVLPLPVVSVSQVPTGDPCQGSLVHFTASNSVSYVWNQSQTGPSIDTLFAGTGNQQLWVIGTDLNSCSDTGFIDTDVLLRPAVDSVIASNPSSCTVADGSITLGGLNASASYEFFLTLPGFVDTSYILTTDVNGDLVMTGLDAGTYSDMYVLFPATGCFSDTLPAVSLQDAGAPTTSIVTDSTTVCAGGTIDLLLSGAGNTVCEWSGPSGFSSTLTHPLLSNADTTMSGIYIVTQTDTLSECTGSAAVSITVSMPHVRILATPNPSCSGQIVLVASEDPSLSTLLWSNGYDSVSFSILLSADSVITLTGTDSIGCMQTDRDTLQVNPIVVPSVQILSSLFSDTICDGAPVTFSAIAADTAGGTTFQWFLNGDTLAGAILWQYTTSTLSNGDVVSVRIHSPDPCASDASDQRTIVVIAPPVIGNTSYTNPTCGFADGSITLSGFASQTSLLVAYNYNGSADTLSYLSNTSGEIHLINLPAGSYADISVGKGSCFSTPLPAAINLFNNINPPAATSPDNTLCVGDTLILQATGSPGATVYWYGPNLPNTASNTIVFTTPVSGMYCAFQEDTFGCTSAPNCVTVNVSPRPVVFITPPYTAVCAGQSATLVGGGASTYQWETGESGDTLTLTNLLTTQDIFVIGANTSGCLDTASAHIQVNEGLLPDHITLDSSYIPYDGVNDTLCNGLTNFSIGVDHPDGFVAYNWSILLGTDTVTSFEVSPDHTSIIFSPEPTSTDAQYVIHLAAASSPQCTVDLSATITVLANSTLPAPSVIWDHVISGRHTLVYLDHTADHYQWGYDDKFSWIPHSIENETFQDFQIGFALDTNSRYYWVMAYYGSCFDKIYFNGPHGRSGTGMNYSGDWSVYPNPTEGVFTLVPERKPFGNLTIEICNLAGQVVMHTSFGEDEVPVTGIRFDLRNFANGVYVLKARDARVAYPPFRLMKSGE